MPFSSISQSWFSNIRGDLLAGIVVSLALIPEAIAFSIMLVMGAYGHSRVRSLILGSTTTHLIRTYHVPVVLFR